MADESPISVAQLGEELIRLEGSLSYWDCLVNLARTTQARSYLEIGTAGGASLAPISCPSIAIDPRFSIATDIVGDKRVCMLFQMKSDEFFATYNPVELLGRTLDFVFLDGMHLYEYLLRDIINTEKHCHRDALIALHDCLPPTFEMTSRICRAATLNEKYINYWTGDVWKVVPILWNYRPDLAITFVDCPPTGLVILRDLDPTSSVLAANYARIIDEFRETPEDFDRLRRLLKGISFSPSSEPLASVDSVNRTLSSTGKA